jgi:xylitol oxidase
MMENQTNWAGNLHYGAASLHYPESIAQVQELVLRYPKLRVLGSRHSFNHIADTDGAHISIERLDPAILIDSARHSVTVAGGVKYGWLAPELERAGFALHNLASLPHISIAGACATATHGSGEKIGNLATAVSAIEFVTADGEIRFLSRERGSEQFNGTVVSLGGLGVVTRLTLDIQPSFEMRQDLYENLELAQLQDHFDEIQNAGYSVSLFTDWQRETFNQVWLKRIVTDQVVPQAEPEFFGATLARTRLHPIGALSAEACTEQQGIPGRWYERLPHFRMDFVPSSGEELQTEYFVARADAFAALSALARLREQIAPLLLISEVRTIAADSLWMSPCYGRESVALHFTWKRDWDAVSQLLPVIEAQLAPFDARPHWGKLFAMPPARLQSLYPRLGKFRELLTHYDPQGKFRNAFLDTHIFSGMT